MADRHEGVYQSRCCVNMGETVRIVSLRQLVKFELACTSLSILILDTLLDIALEDSLALGLGVLYAGAMHHCLAG